MYKPNYIVTDIFKYQLYQTILDVDTDKIKKYALSLKKKSKGRTRSNVLGWQSDDLKDYPPCIQKLIDLIEVNANIFAKQMHIKRELKMDNIWININEYKDTNDSHIHPYAVLSGVFYVDIKDDCGGIRFYNPLAETLEYVIKEEMVEKWAQNNCSRWVVVPLQSVLLLFPGWLRHSVQPNKLKNFKRISISFNLQ
tara:strand:- start:126 stop:713 length:588 start_codon:yes stop_codon:yes gene_type:complete